MDHIDYDYFIGSVPNVDDTLPSPSSWLMGFVGSSVCGLLALAAFAGAMISESPTSMVVLGMLAVALGIWAVLAPKRDRERKEERAQEAEIRAEARARVLRLADVDVISGEGFEDFLSSLYRKEGYSVDEVGGPGDMGADLIVTEMDAQKIAVQAKRHADPVSRRAVSDVATAADYYDCDVATVISNSTFTSGARQLASSLDVRLLGRNRLADWLMRNKKWLLEDLSLRDVRSMEPRDFEWLVLRLLINNGWHRGEVAGGSGDLGIDVVVWRDDEVLVVQAKRYSGAVSRRAVSDARAGARHYRTDRAMVVTTGRFTGDAEELAEAVGCELVGSDTLSSWLVDFP